MEDNVFAQYYADQPPTVVRLAIEPHFSNLTDQQKLYAHHISRASFIGTRIVFRQVSPESEAIYDMIIALYQSCNGDWKALQRDTGISSEDLQSFLEYAAQFLGNAGNYKGFGDSKFIPRLSSKVLRNLVSKTPKARQYYEAVEGNLFGDLNNLGRLHLGFPDNGHLSNYYPGSPDITEKEIVILGEFLAEKRLLPENTRIRRLNNGDFEVLVASGVRNPPHDTIDTGGVTSWQLDGELKGRHVKIVYGDHQEEMAKISLHMKKAGLSGADETQKSMMEEYAKSFSTGSLHAFKESQKHWVKNKSPIVESNIGFIESDRDPSGVRAEWEGFVAVVNQERTRAFGKLVESAPAMIPKLPWDRAFEKDQFKAPDFTSLEVLTFAGAGIPAGINIPNYDDIRREVGFKNVSLANVLGAKAPNEPVSLIHESDLPIYQEYRDHAFEVQVGIHELLGHGTGKLLQETAPGEYNFDIKNPPMNPVTSTPVETYYKLGQTYSSVFGAISSSYEECRAECVAMALTCDFNILKIFGHGDGSEDMQGRAGDLLYASYLSMARAGVVATVFYDPKSGKWGQIHMRARFAILQAFLDAGDDFTKLHYTKDDLSDLTVRVDRSKILTHGRPAVERLLQKLHVYKSAADVEAGKQLYEKCTEVSDFWAYRVRDAAIKKQPPRKIFVQANTFEEDGKVRLKEYEPTLEGMIQSYAERDI